MSFLAGTISPNRAPGKRGEYVGWIRCGDEAGKHLHEQVRGIIEGYQAQYNFSGIALIRQGEITVFHQAFDLAHRESAVPNTVKTRLGIASVAKIFTVTAIMHFVDRDEISLETNAMPLLAIEGTKIRAT